MKLRSFIICMIVVIASMAVLSVPINVLPAQVGIVNNSPINGVAPVPEDYELDVLSGEFAVVGVRPESGDDFDLEVYTDTLFSTLIDSSITSGDSVDFVALEKDVWTSPPDRGVRVTKGTTSYVIEMENEIDSHTTTDTWSGSMDEYPGNPVLDLGPPGSWDDTGVFASTVLYDGLIYHMWYTGFDGGYRRIGYATSFDGIKWVKSFMNPVLDKGAIGSWDMDIITSPSVVYNGGIYHMWYVGTHAEAIKIGYATSPDGIVWTKDPSNPVLELGDIGSWDDTYVHNPTVFYDKGTYHMWYEGNDGTHARIGYATSIDGITWEKSLANPVLDIGPSFSWDGLHLTSPMVIYDGLTYYMWYTGHNVSNINMGYANSIDGINWIKSYMNPVLEEGPSGSWDNNAVSGSSDFYDGKKFHKWYSGKNEATFRIGYAISPDGNIWTKHTAQIEVIDAYEITGINSGSSYSINLEVPSTLDLDMFIYGSTGGRNDAVASSIHIGVGIDESISFKAPTSGDYLLVITNEKEGTGEYTIKPGTSPPVAEAGEDQTFFEGEVVEFNGTGSFDPDGNIASYVWDFDAETDSDGDGNPTNDAEASGSIVIHTYGDNGIFTTTLTVIDTQNLTDTDTSNITVLNIPPSVTLESPKMEVEISLRVAGAKWSNVDMTIYEDDHAIGFIEVERWPGDPDDNPSFGDPVIPITLDLTKSYRAVVTYDLYPDSSDEIRGDQPNNGKDKQDNAGNPVWIVFKFPNGSEERAHHAFNTQQSKKRNSDHWNHKEPWEVDMMELLVGHTFEVSSHVTDPGSDDITLAYTSGSQIVSIIYLNNPPNPDPYPSPEVNPRDLMDSSKLIYEGEETLILAVEDDDGGGTFTSIDIK